jgi:hypothetical protein
VLELQPKAAQTSQKRTAETSVVVGFFCFESLPVGDYFALITQRSDVQRSGNDAQRIAGTVMPIVMLARIESSPTPANTIKDTNPVSY